MAPAAKALDAAFLRLPLAHRALHNRAERRPENSPAAIRAAVAAGYGIEIDVQGTADGQAVVFHDEWMERLTEATGFVKDYTAAELGRIALRDCDDCIPTLPQVLTMVAGRVPLLIELKDHPFFTACQYHPEFLSRPSRPHPLFRGLIEAAQRRLPASPSEALQSQQAGGFNGGQRPLPSPSA